MIRLLRRSPSFPRHEAPDRPANSWQSQWKHIPRSPLRIVRNAMRDGLRTLRG